MLKIIKVSQPTQKTQDNSMNSLRTAILEHAHTVTILNTETGATFEELSGTAEPLEGEFFKTDTLNDLRKCNENHRHKTTAGYIV